MGYSSSFFPKHTLFKAASPAPKQFGDEFLRRAPPPAFVGDGQSRVLLRCPLGSLALSPSPLIIFIVSIFRCEPCLLCQQAYL